MSVDVDWDELAYAYEFVQVRDFNEHDTKFLESQELMLQAKEAGCGYMAEKDGVLYVAPNPVVYVDDEQRYHSDQFPAISWENGLESYYLDGVELKKDLWQRVISQTMTLDELFGIPDADVRAVALKYNQNAIIDAGAKLLDEHPTHGELFKIEKQKINKLLNKPAIYLMRMPCPTGRTFVEAVRPETAEDILKHPHPAYSPITRCQAAAFGVPVEIYGQLRREG